MAQHGVGWVRAVGVLECERARVGATRRASTRGSRASADAAREDNACLPNNATTCSRAAAAGPASGRDARASRSDACSGGGSRSR
jgi:hypothetical protein